MSIGPHIPEVQVFQILTGKIHGQGHRSRLQLVQHPFQSISYSFHVNHPNHSSDVTNGMFDHEKKNRTKILKNKFGKKP